jgi:hypothetical protein
MPKIIATQAAEIRRMVDGLQPQVNSSLDCISKKSITKKRAGGAGRERKNE